ncbi:MAG: hypothetical protein GY769_07100 [bacterium]|nr:hypothetical protein [bacterium]
MSETQTRSWWGDYELAIDETVAWEIGPLRLWLQRRQLEWRLAHAWAEEDGPSEWSCQRAAELPEDGAQSERFAVSETTGAVLLRPLPADRAVVARPKTPLRVLPGQSARIFMSSPMWLEVAVGAAQVPLRELPTKRLSDTWFGATSREGELSYSLKTSARTDSEEMPRAHYRLLTPVVIENRAADPLVFERLSLPVPFLSIYGVETGAVWSEEVHMLRTESGDIAELDVRVGPPEEAMEAMRLGAPRRVAQKGHLFQAFGSLLGFE